MTRVVPAAIVRIMEIDSRLKSLPLPDALLEWSDPALVDGVRTAQAKVDPEELARLDRCTLDDLHIRRRPPNWRRGLPSGSVALAELDEAWRNLFGELRRRIAIPELRLEGIVAGRLPGTHFVELPWQRPDRFLFDPAASAVTVGEVVYVQVRVTRIEPKDVQRRQATDNATRRLRDAIRDLCDARLVERVKVLEWRARTFRTPTARSRLLNDDEGPADLDALSFRDKADTPRALNVAWEALLVDFRQRVIRGAITLSGVQTFPLRQVDRVEIPGVWATDFWLEVDADRIRVVQFGRTVQIYDAISALDASIAPPVQPPIGPAEPPPDVMPDTDGRRARGGRHSHLEKIEAALQEHDEAVQKLIEREGGRVNRRHIARLLEKRMRAGANKAEAMNVPQEETIRKHVGRIYSRRLGETEDRD